MVRRMKHLVSAPEIFVQFNLPLLFAVRRIGMVFFHKKLGPCQAEPVNALFYVPHHKTVVFPVRLAGNGKQKALLHQVAVLVLVHHNLLIKLPALQRNLSRLLRLPVQKNPKRKMLQIVKIQNIFLPLPCVIRVQKFLRQPHQFLGDRPHLRHA